MNTRRRSAAALISLLIAAAGPAAAISPGIAVPPTTAGGVTANSGEIDTAVEEGHAPSMRSVADCRAAQRAFFPRNTVKPSERRAAIRACDGSLASAPSE